MKQLDFDYRIFAITPGGTEGTMTREAMRVYIKENYPQDDGWEVKTIERVNLDGGVVYLGVFLVQYGE